MTKHDITSPTTLSEGGLTFPEELRRKFLDKLDELDDGWSKRDIQTYAGRDTSYLQVRLDASGQPLYFRVADDESGFELFAPVFSPFPREASHFVLADLSGSNALWRFRLEEDVVGEGEQPRQKSETLYAWAPMRFDTFLAADALFLPSLILKLEEAETCVRAHVEGRAVPRSRWIA